jgi:hypothetical protein
VVPVFVLSVLLASWIIPSSHHRALTVIEYAIAPLELAFLGFVGWRTHCGYRRYRSCRIRNVDYDAVDAIRATVTEIVQLPFAARIVSYEISIFYLAIFGWRIPTEHDESRRFTCYRDSSYGILFAALMMVMSLELIGVHVALHIWISPTIAGIVTVLSLYAALWLMGDYQALRLRPIVIESDRVRLRLGLRWEADLPFSKIRSVRPAGPQAEYDLKMVVLGEPKVIVDLTEKVRISGVYGLRRNASRILLAVDSPERFREIITETLRSEAEQVGQLGE